jgi:bacterioferritin-associated ferredoxin
VAEDLIICRCEEVTQEEIEKMIEAGAESLDQVKRLTRASMGLCQGRICRRLLTQVYCEKTGKKPGDITPTTYRPPARPIPMAVLATGIESIDTGGEYDLGKKRP